MKNNNYSHSIMFHHFHDERHPVGQGSISGGQFEEIISWLAKRYNLISADHYMSKLKSNTLNELDICLSFDDALLCQTEIAVPILNKFDLKAFFFVYSSPLVGNPDPLEIYRYFRNVKFSNIDDFYKEFFELAESKFVDEMSVCKKLFDSKEYLINFPFYTVNDKLFRYARDQILGVNKYNYLMNELIHLHNFNTDEISLKLWMKSSDIKNLNNSGHIIGLHSYSHPTMIHKLSKKEQEYEYGMNFEHLESILGNRPVAMSHPCGNYNDDTLLILKKLGIQIGFRSNNSVRDIRSNFEVPRDDHSNILKEIYK